MRKEITFTLEKETKNTYRYQEELSGEPPAIGTLYVQKWVLGQQAPQRIRLTLEPLTEEPSAPQTTESP
jgi:hypothetical protein